MKRALISTLATAAILATQAPTAWAHHQPPGVTLHVSSNPNWKSCAFQLDPSLTQAAWHQFTQEVGVVSYFRPLRDARPMGAGKFEVSVMQWRTGIDETTEAWNNTFVHPQADHWLTDGEPLPIPGLMVTAGISSKVDVSAYLTKNVQSNYGLWGGQLQYNLVNDRPRQFAASARLSLVSLYGPADIDMMVSGLDLTASKTFALGRRISFSPYAEVSTVLTRAHETSAVVNLKDEYTQGYMGTLGAVAKLSVMRLAVEYSAATVNAVSFKVGFDF